MENVKVQTGLRFTPGLIARLKRNAKKNSMSFNKYVENILEKTTAPDFQQLRREDFLPGPEILSLGKTIPDFTREELDNDPKLAYLLSE